MRFYRSLQIMHHVLFVATYCIAFRYLYMQKRRVYWAIEHVEKRAFAQKIERRKLSIRKLSIRSVLQYCIL